MEILIIVLRYFITPFKAEVNKVEIILKSQIGPDVNEKDDNGILSIISYVFQKFISKNFTKIKVEPRCTLHVNTII
jgi:hypothetical protein